MSAAKKLAQFLSIERGVKNRVEKTVTQLYQNFKKSELVQGFSKSYTPKDKDGEQLPPEKKLIIVKADKAVNEIKKALGELFDTTAIKDKTNCKATADVVIDDTPVLVACPSTHLLFLEKQLTLLIPVIESIPTLDPADQWDWDKDQGFYKTAPTEQLRKEKHVEPLVLYPHSDKHPAQVKEITKDVVTGTWSHIKFSGARPKPEVEDMLNKAIKAHKAVKFAIEAANAVEVEEMQSSKLLTYIFG